MKKTEKIELRVDHAEKERLSEIAERRGQTVSDVVRDALSHELGPKSETMSSWPGIVAICASALAIAALGHSVATSGPAANDPIYPTTVELHVSTGRSGPTVFELPLNANINKTLTLRSRDADPVRITITMGEHLNHVLSVEASACAVLEDQCEMISLPTLSINTRPVRGSSARTSTVLVNGQTVEFGARTETRRLEILTASR